MKSISQITTTCPPPTAHYRLGCWMSEKKSKKFNQNDFELQCRTHGLEIVQIDLDRPLEEQGHFAIILHKLTDVIAKANTGDEPSQNIIEAFKDYIRKHPNVVMVDPLEQIQLLLDRTRTYSLISSSKLGREDVLRTPSFVELTTTDRTDNLARLRQAGVTFPFICKPTVAHGSKMAHQMALIFNEDGLKDVSPPCVAQTFVNHDAVLYKLYVVGEKWECVERPSLKNFYPSDHETIFFDSHLVSKADSDCSLNKLDKDDQRRTDHALRPCPEKLCKIVSTVRETLGVGLFGVDVVVSNQNGRYAIVDINAFPGYDGMSDFPRLLVEYMMEQIRLQHQSSSVPPAVSASKPCNAADDADVETMISASPSLDEIIGAMTVVDNGQEDSGIDTGDSSDEKKDQRPIVFNRIFRRLNPKGTTCTSGGTTSV